MYRQAGTYNVSYRISSPYGASSGLQLKSGSTVLATVDIPATGDWQNWQTVSTTASFKQWTADIEDLCEPGRLGLKLV